MKDRDRDLLAKAHAKLGSDNAGDRESAWAFIDKTLNKYRKTWNDLLDILRPGAAAPDQSVGNDDAAPSGKAADANVNPLDLLKYILEDYVELRSSHEYVMLSLWTAHTFVYGRFMVTPRLALVSPVRGCGKTTLLALLKLLTCKGRKHDGITAAAIFRLTDRDHATLLIDEADNLGLGQNGILRAVLNSGHQRGGSITRVIGKEPQQFSTFAPMGIASIGMLPLPIMHRSIVIRMQRATRQNLHRLDENDLDNINIAYAMLWRWAQDVKLQHDPALPKELRNRPADNWRPLIAIGDFFGPAWGTMAREAAIYFSRTHHDEDAAVILLNDIRTAWDDRGIDPFPSATLVEDLAAMDDSLWAEWRGLHDDQQPRPLSQGELARLLKPFEIKPRSIRPRRRGRAGKPRKGYWRDQFTRAWEQFCDPDGTDPGGTPAHPRNIRHLRHK